MLRVVTLRLNLAALTDEELDVLIGPNEALVRMPDISRARLSHQPVPGPTVPETLAFRPEEQRPWGATPEDTRTLTRMSDALQATSTGSLGVYSLQTGLVTRFVRVYALDGDTLALIRWTERGEDGLQSRPHLLLLTALRDRASGVAWVSTSTASTPFAPALSEEIDAHRHPDATVTEAVALHQGYVLRHGRTQKLALDDGWQRAWQAVHDLNLAAWRRRGLLIDEPGGAQSGSR